MQNPEEIKFPNQYYLDMNIQTKEAININQVPKGHQGQPLTSSCMRLNGHHLIPVVVVVFIIVITIS